MKHSPMIWSVSIMHVGWGLSLLTLGGIPAEFIGTRFFFDHVVVEPVLLASLFYLAVGGAGIGGTIIRRMTNYWPPTRCKMVGGLMLIPQQIALIISALSAVAHLVGLEIHDVAVLAACLYVSAAVGHTWAIVQECS